MSPVRSNHPATLALPLLAVLFAVGAVAPDRALAQPSRPARTARQIYEAACQQCHGPDGKGAPQTTLGFDIPVPDFTECTFTSREPSADWGAIANEGGPVRGFHRLMPAFGDALTWGEIELAVAHVKTFCESAAWPPGELNLPRPLATEKAFPEDEAVITTTVNAEGPGSVGNKFVYEKRFGARNQVEVIVPFSSRESEPGGWSTGIGDVAFGAKRALFHDVAAGRIFSVAGEVVLPSGNADRGFGKGVTILEPFASFGQILPADSFVHVQAGMEIPTDTARAAREAFWRIAVGRSFVEGRFGRTWSPMIELLAARELEDGQSVQWDVVPQIQFTLNTRQHLMAAVGVRIPVNDYGPRRTQVMFYLLWDWFDGGLFDGW